ncbi:unnamed protein product [Calypogeia fissa]
MEASSRELFPMHRDTYGDIRSGFDIGKHGSTISNSSQDSLHKFKSMDTNYGWFSGGSPTTTLSIGGDLSGLGKEQDDDMHETILRLKTWSTAPDTVQQDSPLTVDSEMESMDGPLSQNSKGTKRKRKPSKDRREADAEGGSDGDEDGDDDEDSEGIVLFWGSARGGSSMDDLTSNAGGGRLDMARNVPSESTMNLGLSRGLDHTSASSDDTAVEYGGGGRVPLAVPCEDQGTLLQLGQTVGVNPSLEGRVRGGRAPIMTSVVGEGMHLGLAPAGGNSSEMPKYATTLDGVPVVDEGSSSARMSKTGGGFMPALLMGSALNMNNSPIPPPATVQQQLPAPLISFPELMSMRMPEEEQPSAEQDLSMSIRASTSGGTTSTSGASGLSDRASKVCKFRGCSKGARGASGLCIAHGGGQRCEKNGCNKGAEGRTVYCKAHGGGRRCQSLGCTKSAEGKTDYCIGHGGGRRCSHQGCDKAARGRSGLCIRHGGGKRCLTEGCTKSAEGYSGLCISHGGGRRCHFAGCTKGAQGSTMFCKAHGGGKRCMIQGCSKGAEGSTPLCKGHGGGKRCMFDGGGICTKSVHGGTLFCVAHGGGKRCQVQGCTKSARGRTDFCVRHGGGKRCKVVDCGKSAQGSTDFCKAHGGGKRCQWGVEGSGFGEPGKGEVCDKFARGKTGLCAAHSAQVQDRRVHGGTGIGPGITPGLFRGLVAGAGQSRLGLGTSSGSQGMFGSSTYGSSGSSGAYSGKDDSNVSTGLSGQFFATVISGKTGNTSPISTMGLGSSRSAGSELQRSNSQSSVTPSFPAGFAIGQPLIPAQVLVPLSMQNKDTGGSRINHGRPPRPPPTAEGLSMGVGSSAHGSAVQSEGRVHGGGLMAMLSREVSNVGGPDSISLGIATSSRSIDVRWSNASEVQDAPAPINLMEEGLQKQKQLGALGADDVGQFLAARS